MKAFRIRTGPAIDKDHQVSMYCVYIVLAESWGAAESIVTNRKPEEIIHSIEFLGEPMESAG